MPNPPPQRLVFLDGLRIFAFGLLVVYHVGMYYVGWAWHVKSPLAGSVGSSLEPWMRLSSPWRMSLLFLVSGAATGFMLQRAGASGTLLRSRAGRLLMPLLLGALAIVPPQSYFEVRERFGYAGSYLEFMTLYLSGGSPEFCAAPGQRCLILPTWNHLWFLPYLLAYTALLWLLLRRAPRALDAAAARLPALLCGGRLLALPIAWLCLARLTLRDAFPVSHALVDDVFAHAQYLPIFVLGAVLARSGALWQRIAGLRWWGLAATLVAWALWIVADGAARWSWVPISVMQWCGIVAAVGFAQRHCTRDSRLLRTLTDAVFPVYILHQTIIILLAVALRPLALPAALEAPGLIGATFALSFIGYLLVRRVPWLRPWFGLSAPQGADPSLRAAVRGSQ